MYVKELETVPGAKERHDEAHKQIAAARMQRVAEERRFKRERRSRNRNHQETQQ
jgi:hypothetical protein